MLKCIGKRGSLSFAMGNIELKKERSKINGFGIFTKEFIPKGTEFYQIPLEIVYSEPKGRSARIADGRYVFDDKVLNWVNHSCSPNSKLDIKSDKPTLTSIQDILPNKEITIDYDQTEVQGIRIRCTCKSDDCRGYFNML